MSFTMPFYVGSDGSGICVAEGSASIDPCNRGVECMASYLRQTLERRERDLADAFNFTRLAPWGVDLIGGVVEISDAGLTLLGRRLDEVTLTLDGVFSLFHPDDRLRVSSRLSELITEHRSLDDTFRLIHADGSVIHAWFRGHPVTGPGGGIVAIRGIWQDVTARVTTEATLRESEENHRHAVELSPQIPWTAGPDGRLIEAGPRWSLMTGLHTEQASSGGWLQVVHPEDGEGAVQAWTHSVQTGEPFDCDYRLRLADGTFRWMRARAAARHGSDGLVLRWYGSLEDINDRKVAERRLKTSEAFSRSVLESSGDCIIVLDRDATVRFVNAPAAAMSGYCIEEFVGRNWLDVLPAPFRAEARAALEAANAGGSGRLAAYIPNLPGDPTWWDVAVNLIKHETGDVQGILVIARDVTDKRMARLDAEAAHFRLADVLESTADNVLSVDRSWRVTYMNGNAIALLGERLNVGGDLLDTYPEYMGTAVHLAYLAAMEGTPTKLTDLYLVNLGIWVDLNLRPTRDGISVFLRDVTEAHEARRAVTHLANHDPLTGLANRARYATYVEEQCSAGPFGLLILDLDDFKEINDTLGHSIGDALLVEAAARFRRAVGDSGLLARLGGDEFAVAVPGGSIEDCVNLAETLLASLREPIIVERHELKVGVCVGVAVEPLDAPRETLFKKADVALYQAKADGGDRLCLYDDELHRRVGARQALKQDLSMGIERDELSVAYQPMRDLATGLTCAREALMRWQHPIRGPVSPAEFIPIAEETGLIVEMGEWILRQACVDANRWSDGAVVSVNLSPVQFHSGSLPMKVAQALAVSGLPPYRLELEITESVLLRDSDENLTMLHALKALGVRIALDDFGTGFSSLSYLRNFPFDKIKIDRTFVSDIGAGNHSEAILASVISLGRTLGMTITAEGIETEEQLRWLAEHGCHQAQGYLIGRPAPVDLCKRPFENGLNG